MAFWIMASLGIWWAKHKIQLFWHGDIYRIAELEFVQFVILMLAVGFFLMKYLRDSAVEISTLVTFFLVAIWQFHNSIYQHKSTFVARYRRYFISLCISYDGDMTISWLHISKNNVNLPLLPEIVCTLPDLESPYILRCWELDPRSKAALLSLSANGWEAWQWCWWWWWLWWGQQWGEWFSSWSLWRHPLTCV